MAEGHIKGSLVVQPVKYIRSKKQQALPLMPAHLERYLSGRILPTSWHSEQDHLDLMRISAELFAGPEKRDALEVWEEMARATAPVYFDGTYHALVRKGDPGRTLVSFSSLWGLQHDNGRIVVDLTDETTATIQLQGYVLASSQMCAAIQGTMEGLLEVAGAKGVKMHHTRCRASGDKVCEWQATWDPTTVM